ncbi:hypothetical protein [Amycolatopsis sp. H20-H5]|uniref:hypothetical protein n=1 Tax=Amycolatopsis sp. H20-H5 TaxID=3046309 RepID=UPI002DB753F7|nr:hypothetical protein [Amycolatopsis sp. H20-H5]MEC3975085.1 hypothetical protein [Amycolatopsis sp. H20-H5]
MGKTSLTVNLRIEGVRETLAAFKELPADANNELRDASQKLAKAIAAKAVVDAHAHGGPQGKLLAPTIKAARDRVPMVTVGGTRKVGHTRAPAYGLLFGSVFGYFGRSGWYAAPRYHGGRGRQYRPHRGQDAYWFFPLVESEAPAISSAWNHAADQIVRRFSAGGDL